MAAAWRLLTDDTDERQCFVDLETTLSLPSTPAAPDNRLRHVTRIETAGGACYLKTFRRTQGKNRVRFALTRPRAADDAERELLVTQALRAAGIDAPRPIAHGRRGASSFYLCAELDGQPLATWLQAPARSNRPARAAAEFCGRLLAAGFWLPDLSPDHVFVRLVGDDWRCAVLDLHNGRLGRTGPPPLRLLRRVLRRFARAVGDAPVSQRATLGFACRLIRAAGHGRRLRHVLRRLPPLHTAARYEVMGRSRAYAKRNPLRAERELGLLRRVWPGNPRETVLDLPCGAGRLLPLLASEFGHRVCQGDGAWQMLRRARDADHAASLQIQADALTLPFADRAIDGAVLFRFLHHLPKHSSDRAIAEACRVTRRFVVVSFFHPCSFHHLERRLGVLAGRAATRFARTLGDVRRSFAAHGFRLERHAADLPFARDLWVASFVRD